MFVQELLDQYFSLYRLNLLKCTLNILGEDSLENWKQNIFKRRNSCRIATTNNSETKSLIILIHINVKIKNLIARENVSNK